MSLHGFDYVFTCAEFLENSSANIYMRALNFVIHGLTYVMEKGPGFGDSHIGAQFFRQHTGDVRHFYRMLEHILAVGSTELQAPQNGDYARVEVNDAALKSRLFAFFADKLIEFFFSFLNQLFNFSWLDASVCYQGFQSFFGYSPAYRVKRG